MRQMAFEQSTANAQALAEREMEEKKRQHAKAMEEEEARLSEAQVLLCCVGKADCRYCCAVLVKRTAGSAILLHTAGTV